MKLRQLWDENCRTQAIADLLGVSKNAVIGKAHRLNLSGRPSPIRAPIVPGERVTVRADTQTAGPRGCQWIHGHPHGTKTKFCGEPGFPWSPAHHARVFVKAEKKEAA